MSDLGQQAYKPYWTSTIADYLSRNRDAPHKAIMDISKETSIMCEDIVFTLNQMGLLRHIGGEYFIAASDSIVDSLVERHPIKRPTVEDKNLHWTPHLTEMPKRDKFSVHSKRPPAAGQAQAEGEGMLQVTGDFNGGRGREGGSGALGR